MRWPTIGVIMRARETPSYRSDRLDRLLAAVAWAAAALVALPALLLFADVIWQGAGRLSWEFLAAAPRDAGRAGGIAPILVSTALLLAVAMAVAAPLGLATAVYLTEVAPPGSRAARAVRVGVDVLAGVPSIVFGLFGNALFCRWLGFGYSILSGGLTLACMVLPILVRALHEGLSRLPRELRQAATALALPRHTQLVGLLLPAAAPALAAGLVLGTGRALSETAALVFTSGYADRMPGGLLDSGRALSVHIYDLAMNVPGGNRAAYASAAVLLALLLLIDAATSRLTSRWLAALPGGTSS